MAIINTSDYNIKINYADITNNPLLANLLPLTIIAKAKDVGYIYYSDLDDQLKYNIAYTLFKNQGIIKISGSFDTEVLDHSKLPFTDRSDLQPIEEINQVTLIDYFIRYNIEVNSLLVTVYKNEYQTVIKVPSIFMDVKPDDLFTFETDINEFIITVYRKFISTPYGSITFLPWYGTRIKEYIHELSPTQVSEMLQAEIDGISGILKTFFVENNILDYNFTAEVIAEENTEYGIVNYKIVIIINNVQYTITIK